MFRFLTRERAAAVEQMPEISFDSRHIPYVETLYDRLRAAAQLVADRRAYLREANELGVKAAALTAVANQVVEDETTLRHSRGAYDRIRQLLAFAEPTEPNSAWYCGQLEEPERDEDGRYPRETWPTRYTGYSDPLVWQGATPVAALRALARAKPLVDEVRVYSPNIDDFRVLRSAPRDPVLIGMIRFLGEETYFELARWDIDQDLAVLFGHEVAPR